MERRLGVTGVGLDAVIPTIGSKELIASLPTHLGVGPGDLVVHPELAYPTYEVGAMLAGARTLAADSLTAIGPEVPRLLWLNSPANPTGRVLPVDHLRKVVDWCRERGTVLVSDECYIELGWDARAGLGAPPRRLRRLVRRHPGGPLAEQAQQPGRLPLRLRRRRPRAGRRAARGSQEPRPDDARPPAGRDGGRPGRRRPRRRATRAVRRPPGRAAPGPGGCGVPDRPLRGVAVPLGDARARTAGRPSPTSPSSGSWSRRARSTVPPAASTSGSP